jgi:glycosyltransferase involved in cell wall biosynthesis
MAARTVLVCEAQVPFVEGGAERLVRQLVHHLREHGHRAELVTIPFKWYPKQEILAHAAAWRLIDLSESNGQPVDLVIATKFPSYFVRHPNKVTWLVHQYRAAYELCGTPFSDFEYTELDVGLRETLLRLDRQMLLESRRLFTISRTTTGRLDKYLGIHAEPLYHPPRLAPRLRQGTFGDYVLSVGRIESIKRVDLAVAALAHTRPPLRLVVVGEGTQRENRPGSPIVWTFSEARTTSG